MQYLEQLYFDFAQSDLECLKEEIVPDAWSYINAIQLAGVYSLPSEHIYRLFCGDSTAIEESRNFERRDCAMRRMLCRGDNGLRNQIPPHQSDRVVSGQVEHRGGHVCHSASNLSLIRQQPFRAGVYLNQNIQLRSFQLHCPEQMYDSAGAAEDRGPLV